ncbi:MAG: hypothetical protein ACR2RF_22250 [Geminicoccaceae bacterium]
MNDQKKASQPTQGAGISEAERMAKIRELLVGPVIADESARVDQSVARLNELVEEQHQTIIALQSRLGELEDSQRVDMKRVRLGLLGIAETLLADEEDVRSRVMRNETLRQRLENDDDCA